MNKIYDSLIIGAGPCGISTAIKLKDANIDFLIFEKETPGGKVNIAPKVDNYPGEKEILGPDLAFKFFQRLLDNNINVTQEEIISISKENDIFILKSESNVYYSKSVVVATGTKEKKLGLKNEDNLFGKGISYCALCDARFFKGQEMMVVGNDETTFKEALYLLNVSSKLYFVIPEEVNKANQRYLSKFISNPKVEIFNGYKVDKIYGTDSLEKVVISNESESKEINVKVLFPLIGQTPNSDFISFDIKDMNGNILVNKDKSTSIEGLFAGGDVLSRDIRQIYLVEYDGKIIANSVVRYLENR